MTTSNFYMESNPNKYKKFDPAIKSGLYRRAIRFRREKLKDEEGMKSLFVYLTDKIVDRYKDIIAGRFKIQLFEQDGDNVIKDMVTAIISFEYIKAD